MKNKGQKQSDSVTFWGVSLLAAAAVFAFCALFTGASVAAGLSFALSLAAVLAGHLVAFWSYQLSPSPARGARLWAYKFSITVLGLALAARLLFALQQLEAVFFVAGAATGVLLGLAGAVRFLGALRAKGL